MAFTETEVHYAKCLLERKTEHYSFDVAARLAKAVLREAEREREQREIIAKHNADVANTERMLKRIRNQ